MDASVVFNRKNWAYLAEAVTTNSDSNVVGTELANFNKVLKHHENMRKAGCIDTVYNSLEVEATRIIQNAKTTKSKFRGFFMMKQTVIFTFLAFYYYSKFSSLFPDFFRYRVLLTKAR